MLIPMALHTAPKQYFNKKSNLHTRCTELPAGGGKIDHILLGSRGRKKCNNADNWFNNSCQMLTSNIETRWKKSLWLIFKVIIGVTNNNMDEEGAVNL